MAEKQHWLDYGPFAGAGARHMYYPVPLPTQAQDACGSAVTRRRAQEMIRDFIEFGKSFHPGAGEDLWVILAWCAALDVSYSLEGSLGHGWQVRRLDAVGLAEQRRPCGTLRERPVGLRGRKVQEEAGK